MQMDIYSLAAFMGAFFVVFLIVGLAVYLYSAFALMTIARKTRTENGWLAFIPIANFFLMANIAKVTWWSALAMIVTMFIPYVGGVVALVISLLWWWKIAEQRDYPGWMGILMIVPVVNLIVMGILAWHD